MGSNILWNTVVMLQCTLMSRTLCTINYSGSYHFLMVHAICKIEAVLQFQFEIKNFGVLIANLLNCKLETCNPVIVSKILETTMF